MPLVPLALERMGHDKLTIGIVAAAWGVGMLATASHIPRLAARLGAVPFIVGAVVAGSAITVAYTLTDSVVIWFILTLLHGITGGVPWVVSEIWMNVVVEEKRRGRVMAVYSMLVALGLALGPFVLQIVGVYGPQPFNPCAILALLVALPLLPYWKTAPKIEHAEDSGYLQVVVLAPLAMLAGFACGVGRAGRLASFRSMPSAPACRAEIGALGSPPSSSATWSCNGRSAGWPTISTGASCWRLRAREHPAGHPVVGGVGAVARGRSP